MNSSPVSVLYQLLFALSSLHTVSAVPNLWAVNIEEGPAPPPDKGPPLSANAIRNTSYLPYDLVAIFASYLVALLSVAVAIVVIGRRRKAIQRSPKSLGIEMKTTGLTGDARMPQIEKLNITNTPQSHKLFGPSPISPSKFWNSPNLSMKQGWENVTGKSSRKTSVAGMSIATADESVIEEDRVRNEMEMDRLYSFVAVHEAQKQLSPTVDEVPALSPDEQSPPELQHLRYGVTRQSDHGPAEMVEPYPSRTSTISPRTMNSSVSPPGRTPSGSSGRQARGKKTPPAPLSLNATAHSSRTSLASAHSRSIRHYPISPPMGSPGIAPDYGDMYGEHEPLTPRAYAPGPPPVPPTPTSAVVSLYERETSRHREVLASPQHPPDFVSPRATHFAPSIRSSRSSAAVGLPTSPRSTRTGPLSSRSAAFPRIAEQPSREASLNSAAMSQHSRGKPSLGGQSYASCESEIQPGFDFSSLAQPDTSGSGRGSPTGSTHTNASAAPSTGTTATRKTRKAAPPTLALQPSSASGSAANVGLTLNLVSPPQTTGASNASSSNLPFRDMRGMLSPTSRGPPSAIKATFLDRPGKKGPPGGLLRAPATGGLAPMTPYSPYMPQTPMTPMTPSRLVTREERKRREREEGRRVLTQDDVVQEESEMWGDGYD